MSGSKELSKAEAVGFVLNKSRYVDAKKWKKKKKLHIVLEARDISPSYSFKLILRTESSDKPGR